MSDEKKESRTKIEDLPLAEQELTSEEAKDVKGGITPTYNGDLSLGLFGDTDGDRDVSGADAIRGPHVKKGS